MLATFIPWVVYFIHIMHYRIEILESKGQNREKYFSYINKNFFSSINIKELFLFFVFLLFVKYENTTVLEILFSAMYVYLLIDFLHGPRTKGKKIQHKGLMFASLLLIAAIIGYFIISGHLYTTYDVMFVVSIMSTFIVYIFGLPIIYAKKKD